MLMSAVGSKSRLRLSALHFTAAALLICSGVLSGHCAQGKVLKGSSSGVFLPSNRLDTRGIQRAKELIALGEFSQAIRFLDEVLARTEDSFVEDRDKEVFGLQETAHRILKDLPLEGYRIYESTYGPVARRLLAESVQSGDPEQLRKIAKRYFYTPAGHEAALLFAQHESDQGRHLTASLTYQQLLETAAAAKRFQPQLSILTASSWLAAGYNDRAVEVLNNLRAQGYTTIELAAEKHRLPDAPTEMVSWLVDKIGSPQARDTTIEQQWLTARGNPARNGQTEGGLPHLRVRWQVRLLGHQNLETVYEEMAQLLARQSQPRLPAASPLAVGDYVITRSAHGLIAIDFKTGKRVWQAQPQRISLLQNLVDASNRPSDNRNIEPAQSFARLIWEDYLYNTTSSDGQRVYVIRDLTLPKLEQSRSIQMLPRSRAVAQGSDTNRLCAYDLPTEGKLVWEIDGAARSDQLQGVFFLGAPVTVGQSLYCLAEIKSETAIYLIVLDRKTGKLQWRQQLADLEIGINRDVKRRLQTSMPSYDEGMLVCPTSAGVVVGVDLAKQALAWAYRYPTQRTTDPRQRILMPQRVNSKSQWVHTAPVISKGRVLLAPPEAAELHCLDLFTGKLLWKSPRRDSMLLAGVDEENVLLVGNRHMTALRLRDGKPAWKPTHYVFPEQATPTGSGFLSKGKYFLPLSNAQIVAVDTSRGELAAKASSRDGKTLGNLICYRGAVLSQSGRYLDCFEQVEVLRAESERRRAADPTDYEALRTLGEIAFNEGQLDRAIEMLSLAYQSAPQDIRTREVLGEALVAALDERFAEYQGYLSLLVEIQPESTKSKFALMRLQAKGLLELGRTRDAFSICLQAYDQLSSHAHEMSVGQDHQVDARRWLTAQTTAVWKAASPEDREELTQQLTPLLTEVRELDNLPLKQRFYDCFRSLALTDTVGLELAGIYLEQGDWLVAQQLLMHLTASEDMAVRNSAVAQCSRLLHEAGKPRLAAKFDRQLRGKLAEVECLPGKTGLECLAEWSMASERSWPYGQVEIAETNDRPAGAVPVGRSPRSGIYLERSDEVLGSCNVTLLGMVSGRNRMISIRDSLGREFYRAKVDQGSQMMMNAQGSIYGVAKGNLLILSLGRQIVAYDTLSDDQQPLWRHDTMSNLQYVNQRPATLRRNLGRHLTIRPQSNGRWLGLIGPVTHDSCVFQVEQRLVCVDALSGKVKWSRENIPAGCDLFGDEQFVFAVPKDSQQAFVFSTIDGRSLGTTPEHLPVWQEKLTTVGGNIIRWRRRTDLAVRKFELSSLDALEGEVAWSHEFEQNSQIDVAQNRFVAIAEPSGRGVVVDLESGQLLVDQPLVKSMSMKQLYFLAGTDSFVLAVQHSNQRDRRRLVRGFNTIDYSAMPFNGQIAAFDRVTGSSLWERPAEVKGLPFVLSQAVDLPVITLAGNIRRQDNQGTRNETGIMLLEKQSGRLLFQKETLAQSPGFFQVRASDEQANQAMVELSSHRITLTFTENPRPPEPPALHKVQRNIGNGTRGLQKIGEKFLGGG